MADEPTKRRRLGSFLTLVIGLAVVGGAGFGAFVLWQQKDLQLAASRQALAASVARGPRVQTVLVAQGPQERLITLLGDARAYQVATLYSKIGGYLKSISVDRGDMVAAGQLLAEIDSPETDNQYASAVSDLENKRRNAKRARDLAATGSKSLQAIEQAETDFRMAESRVAELATLKSYQQIKAPFAGRITARFIDPGALVQNSTSNQTSNQPVVTLADDRRLRINVYVEQRDVPFVKAGDLADVSDGADSTRVVRARIARTSGQLDPRTRTLFVEIEVDNEDRFLVPGSFAYVTLHVPVASYPQIPVAALTVRGSNTSVAVVDESGIVRFRPVKVAQTDGIRVSLSEGVKQGERVAINLPDEVADGSTVQPVATAAR